MEKEAAIITKNMFYLTSRTAHWTELKIRLYERRLLSDEDLCKLDKISGDMERLLDMYRAIMRKPGFLRKLKECLRCTGNEHVAAELDKSNYNPSAARNSFDYHQRIAELTERERNAKLEVDLESFKFSQKRIEELTKRNEHLEMELKALHINRHTLQELKEQNAILESDLTKYKSSKLEIEKLREQNAKLQAELESARTRLDEGEHFANVNQILVYENSNLLNQRKDLEDRLNAKHVEIQTLVEQIEEIKGGNGNYWNGCVSSQNESAEALALTTVESSLDMLASVQISGPYMEDIVENQHIIEEFGRQDDPSVEFSTPSPPKNSEQRNVGCYGRNRDNFRFKASMWECVGMP